MITEFDSIFHENGFIFVNEAKKDIAAQMAARVDGQRAASKEGHYFGKGKVRQIHKNHDKVGSVDQNNLNVDNQTGKSNKMSSTFNKEYYDKKEKEIQERRAKKKQLASKIGQKNINKALGEKKREAKQESAALMESIELI